MTSSISGEKVASTLPSLSSIRVTNIGATRIPLLGNAVYALTISPTDISQGPRQRAIEGTISRLRTPKLCNNRFNSYGFNLLINRAVIQLSELAKPHFKVTISP